MKTGLITSRIKSLFHLGSKKIVEEAIGLDDSVAKVMKKRVHTVNVNDSASSVRRLMVKKDIGSVVVLDFGKPVGIITETDFFKEIIALDIGLDGVQARQMMKFPLVAVKPDIKIISAVKTMASKKIRRLPVMDDDHLVGIVAETDIIPIIADLDISEPVESVMTKEVVTAGIWYDVDRTAELMSLKDVGSVVLMESGMIRGVVTERDMLRKVLADRKQSADEIKVGSIMTTSVKTINPQGSISEAAKMMCGGKFRRLPVVEEGVVVGIITQTDILGYIAETRD
jgi:CBS domain-containing protein